MSCVLTHFSRSVVFHKETFEMKWFCRSFDWLLYEMNRPWLETIISFVLNNSMAISCLLLRKKCFFHVIILASLMLLSSGKFVEFFFDIHAVNVISADLMDLRQAFIRTRFQCTFVPFLRVNYLSFLSLFQVLTHQCPILSFCWVRRN